MAKSSYAAANKAGGGALSPCVLVVDDDSSIRTSMSAVLGDEGFEVHAASSGEEAISRLEELHPAVVFLDIWMPGRDGIETLQSIKEASPETEVIMISGHATISNAMEATKRGAFDFIEKPFDIESVILSASRAFEKHFGRPKGARTRAVEDAKAEPQPVLSHPGILSTGLAGANIGQRTLKRSAILYGKGLHSGQKSGLVLEPLPINSGIHFSRIGDSKTVPAFVDYVESTAFATSIRLENVSASTVEHLLSTLHAFRISNLLVKCNGEVPIFDGSAVEFCNLIESVGIDEQGADWWEIAVDREIVVSGDASAGNESLRIEPADGLIVSYELNYPEPVGAQRFEYRLGGVDGFKQEIAPARTFGFMKDIERLQQAGLAAGGRLDNFILIGSDSIVNTTLRLEEELARHKILDILGDLFLLGRPLRGKITARMSGHSDNVALINQLRPLICA